MVRYAETYHQGDEIKEPCKVHKNIVRRATGSCLIIFHFNGKKTQVSAALQTRNATQFLSTSLKQGTSVVLMISSSMLSSSQALAF